MRNTSLRAASMALLCAPLLTTAYAAPRDQSNIEKRNNEPVRRQNSAVSISNESPSSVNAAPAPSEAPSIPASLQVQILPSSIALPSVIISIPSEPSIVSVEIIISSVAPNVEILPSSAIPVALPSSEAPPPTLPSSAAPQAAQPSSNAAFEVQPASAAAPIDLFSSAIVQSAAIPSVAILSEIVPAVASIIPAVASIINVVPSLVVPSNIVPTLAPISEVLSSVVGGAVGLVSSIALPSAPLVEAVPSATGYVAPSILPSSFAPQASGGVPVSILNPIISELLPSQVSAIIPVPSDGIIVPLVQSLLNPSGGLVSQIIVGLNTIISEALAVPSSIPDVLSLGGLDLSSALAPVVSALPTGLTNPIAPVQSVLSGVVDSLPSGIIQVIPSVLPSVDVGSGLASAIPSIALPSDGIISILPSNGGVPLPVATAFPSGGAILPSEGLPASLAVSGVFPQPSALVSEILPLPSAGITALPPTPSGLVSLVGQPLSGGLAVSALPPPAQSAGLVTAALPISTKPGDRIVSATGSDANTAIPGPSDIVIAPSDASKATSTPTNLPKVIQPPGGKVSKQANTTLVQLGFLEPLNYPFVSANEDAINQIFQFMPVAVATGLQSTDVKMQSIQPYDTLKTWKYMTTLAMLYVPTDSIAQLTLALHDPNSLLYKNADARITTLMSFVNPAIPLLAGQAVDSAAASAATPTYSPGSSSGADPFGADSKSGNPVNTSSAAIATPLAVGAVVYGCAMIFVARRYKQRRQSHRRASSISGEPAWMTEARAYNSASRESHSSGGSSRGTARTQQISAPLASSNSLGW